MIGGEKENPRTFATIDEVPMKLPVHVAIANPTDEKVSVQMGVNARLVDEYNGKFKKNYKLLPEGSYQLEHPELTIEPNHHTSESPLLLNLVSRDMLEEGSTYLLPISILKVTDGTLPVLSSSGTVYIVMNQIIITTAADLSKSSRFLRVDFSIPSKYPTLAVPKLTYEARIKVPQFKKSYWCNTVMGLEEWFCFRFVQDDFMGQLQSAGGGYSLTSTKQVPANTWVHVACVWDGENTSIYINGEFDCSVATPNRTPVDLTKAYGGRGFVIAQSAGNARYLNGYMSEVRVWATARTASELKNNMCWVDPSTEGLIAYWRFNNPEETQTISDLSGNGYNAVFSKTTPMPYIEGVRCPE